LNQSRIPRLSAESTNVVLWSSIFLSASTFLRKIANSSFLAKLSYSFDASRSPCERIAWARLSAKARILSRELLASLRMADAWA